MNRADIFNKTLVHKGNRHGTQSTSHLYLVRTKVIRKRRTAV
jgi:hypothetical protein